MLNVKEAVKKAIEHSNEILEAEKIDEISLEEVEHDGGGGGGHFGILRWVSVK